MKTCETLKEKILAKGAQYLECSREEVDFDGKKVFCLKDGREISLMEIGNRIMCNNEDALFASESYSSPVSPPPFMVGMAEVDVDQETGEIELVDYVAVVDCGTVVNPSLARVQTEGGIAQGIGMALLEQLNKTWETINRILNDNGVLIVAVPNCESYDAKKYRDMWAAYDVPRHLWHFTPTTISKLASKHGFALTERYPMPFDAFYVSMLSEKYKKKSFTFIRGLLTGTMAWLSSLSSKDKSSSMIYIFRKKFLCLKSEVTDNIK